MVVALAGNPNVGKSCLFNQLTGLSVVTANYPGKTVALNFGMTKHEDTTIGLIDLPGTYALGAVSDDQQVARRALLDSRPDVVVVVVDASNLQRNLYMVLQLAELGFPLVICLNLIDYAAKIGLNIDHVKLEQTLGVPVVPAVAVRGEGVDETIHAALVVAKEKRKPATIRYDGNFEKYIGRLQGAIERDLREAQLGVPSRALALLLLEGDVEFIEAVRRSEEGEKILELSSIVSKEMEEAYGEPAGIRVSRERHELAGTIADAVQTEFSRKEPLSEKLKRYTVNVYSGIPIMLGVMLSVFIFVSTVGQVLSSLIEDAWGSFFSPAIAGILGSLVRNHVLENVLAWGFDAGILSMLSVGVAYILPFYIVLSLLEDSGYLNSLAFLMDNVMHRLGLHGRAAIPIITGLGCNVPAIVGTRVLMTKRERILASTLIVLVPCSARIAVILGSVSAYLGLKYALLIYAIDFLLIVAVGMGLNRLLPGRSMGLVMEMFPFRFPSLSTTMKKTWFRLRDFIRVALPITLMGSFFMGALFETGYLWTFSAPLSPLIVGLLGFPAVTGLSLVLGILRKELALELLVALAIAQYGQGASNLLTFMTQSSDLHLRPRRDHLLPLHRHCFSPWKGVWMAERAPNHGFHRLPRHPHRRSRLQAHTPRRFDVRCRRRSESKDLGRLIIAAPSVETVSQRGKPKPVVHVPRPNGAAS
jgi:ferrous iron transport protein B